MGYIIIRRLNFGSTPASNINVRVEYRLASSSGLYTIVSSSTVVLSNGNFSPEIQVSGLSNGETYTVKITPLCGGVPVVQNIVAGESCTSFTLEAQVGGATVEWNNCASGEPQSTFVAQGNQINICTRTQDGYRTLFGAVTEISNNGSCQN